MKTKKYGKNIIANIYKNVNWKTRHFNSVRIT